MPRGGRRSGRPGRNYPQRSDLRGGRVPIQAAPGQTYGVAGQQMAAQRAVPVAPPPASRAAPTPAGPAGPPPGALGPFDRPTERPDEPLTAGLDIGEGPGSEVLTMLRPPPDNTAEELRAIYSRFPNEDLRELIEELDEELPCP